MNLKTAMSPLFWCSLVSPLSLAAATVLWIGLGLLHESARVVRRAELMRSEIELASVRIAAETAILRSAQGGLVGDSQAIGGHLVQVDADADGWTASVGVGDGVRCFHASRIPGASHPAFGRACSVAETAPLGLLANAEPLGAAGLPQLQPDLAAQARACDRSDVFERDPSVALGTWETGTDGDDFVFTAGAGQAMATGADLLVVPGHLWLPPAEGPWCVRLTRDLVVVVQGNLYLGCSVRVLGGGRLLFVTMTSDGAVAFADRDGNGRWSSGDVACRAGGAFVGPLEGGGAVFLGLPTASGRLSSDAGLVAHGELQVWGATEVAGPLVLGAGVTRNRQVARVRATGAWTYQVEREQVPGMVTTGVPRPGLLQEGLRNRPTMAKQTLYLSSPSR